MNRRGEGTASKMIIILTLFLGGIMVISNLVTNLAVSYEREDLPEFKVFEDNYNEMQTFNEDYGGTQKGLNNTPENDERYEDSIIRQAMRTLSKAKSTTKFYGRTINMVYNQSTAPFMQIPDPVKTTIWGVLIVTLVVLIVSAYWRYNRI